MTGGGASRPRASSGGASRPTRPSGATRASRPARPSGATRASRPARPSGVAPASRLRLFVALDLPAAAVDALARFRDDAADPVVWRSLDVASFHVTLAFLGHRPEGDVPLVAEVLAGLAPRDPPALELGAGLLLPPRRARVLTVALGDDGGLAELQAEVSDGLAAAGVYAPEARPFRPHVTVARVRPGARPPRAIEAAPEPIAFRAGDVVLYRSRLSRDGAAYEPLVTRRL
jgi:RNA 2',3'-cyclic 3'-phosphodiesterase